MNTVSVDFSTPYTASVVVQSYETSSVYPNGTFRIESLLIDIAQRFLFFSCIWRTRASTILKASSFFSHGHHAKTTIPKIIKYFIIYLLYHFFAILNENAIIFQLGPLP